MGARGGRRGGGGQRGWRGDGGGGSGSLAKGAFWTIGYLDPEGLSGDHISWRTLLRSSTSRHRR